MSKQLLKAADAAYRYGMLIVILVLLAWQIRWYFTFAHVYNGDPYGTGILVLALLFNHLAFAFNWPRAVAIALWVLAGSWIVFSLFYVFYLSRVLYPLETPPVP